MCVKFGTTAEEFAKLGLRAPTADEVLDGLVLGFQQAATELFASFAEGDITEAQYTTGVIALRHAASYAGEQTQSLVRGEAHSPRDDAWNITGEGQSQNSAVAEV